MVARLRSFETHFDRNEANFDRDEKDLDRDVRLDPTVLEHRA